MATYKPRHEQESTVNDALIAAVGRYLQTTEHPDEDIILAILGFEREDED